MKLSLDAEKRYTYADCLTWPEGKQCELVNGFIRNMPVHDARHQEISTNMSLELYGFIKRYYKGKGEVFYAPFVVRFPKNGETGDDLIDTVVQPDICVVCDRSKLDENGCLGAPDFIAEIQSPLTVKYNLDEKFKLYETAGVQEYWIISPEGETVQVFILQPDGKYDQGTLYETGKVPVYVFEGIEVELKNIFQ
ncbi:MAG: Uma2 family endonuclease [Prevotellaceae bacterium]|jgi:Uma2 family endonuclease|nr:Uma2 family endonuclease [Prevotellaceae bacterium]